MHQSTPTHCPACSTGTNATAAGAGFFSYQFLYDRISNAIAKYALASLNKPHRTGITVLPYQKYCTFSGLLFSLAILQHAARNTVVRHVQFPAQLMKSGLRTIKTPRIYHACHIRQKRRKKEMNRTRKCTHARTGHGDSSTFLRMPCNFPNQPGAWQISLISPCLFSLAEQGRY